MNLSALAKPLPGYEIVAILAIVHATGTVRFWRRSEGWGVVDSAETPGGCFVHFTHLWNGGPIPIPGPGEGVEVSGGGFLQLFEGETVEFEWECPMGGQDGYSYRATTVRPRRERLGSRVIRHYQTGEHPNSSAGFEFWIEGAE